VAPDQTQMPSFVQVLQDEILAGIGPLVSTTLRNIVSALTTSVQSTALEITNRVTGGLAGRLLFPAAYQGIKVALVTYPAGRPEYTTAGSVPSRVQWQYSARLRAGHARPSAVNNTGTTLFLIGDVVEIATTDAQGRPIAQFSPSIKLEVPV